MTLTLDEAIALARDYAFGLPGDRTPEDHRRLARWLEELKSRRETEEESHDDEVEMEAREAG